MTEFYANSQQSSVTGGIYEPSRDVCAHDAEIAVHDDEVREGTLHELPEAVEAELGGGRSSAELCGVIQGQSDVAHEKTEHAIHRRDAAGERAVFEVGRRFVDTDAPATQQRARTGGQTGQGDA